LVLALDAHVLAGAKLQRLQRTARDDGDVAATPFVVKHFGMPIRRVDRVGLRTGEHFLRNDGVRVAPGLVVFDRPLVAGERAQRLHQRAADDVVMLRLHVELPMVPAQRAQVLVEAFRVVDGLYGGHNGTEQPRALYVHLDREQVPKLGVGQEHARVEIACELVLLLLDERPALLE
jgi:hypothetical protein